MKQHLTPHRRVAALLFAAAALPFTPGLAQETTAAPPPLVVTPPPVVIAPPAPVSTAPPVAPIVMPPVSRAAPPPEPEARPATRTTRAATRAPARQAAPTRRAPTAVVAPAPASVAEPTPAAVEPVATTPLPAPEASLPPVIAEESAIPVETGEPQGSTPWALIAAIVGLIAAAAALFLLVRNRRRRVERDDVYHDAPVVAAPITPSIEPQPYIAPYVAPALVRDEPAEAVETAEAAEVAPVDTTPAVETLSVGEPDSGDVAAMTAASQPEANRPWLEMLMRPLRAGTTSDDARVEFDLTVGNTGSVSARDVKISTWMFPAGGQSSEMERLLIDSETSIEPGDGTRVQAAIAMNKAQFDESVLPVVVADARYTLPDGSEGRTQAAFAFGLAQDGELVPFPTDRSSGLLETVEARLHGDLKRN